MKITFFVPTEVRPPKVGDHFRPQNGDIVRATFSHEEAQQIGFIRDIEVPEEADTLSWQAYKNVGSLKRPELRPVALSIAIPLSRHVKVKKWQWLRIVKDGLGRSTGQVSGWLTEREAAQKGHVSIDRICDTEIETEE
jgi:hypothetical protein